ncbi:MAG: hypothetical protein Q8L37_04140 [Candidatus Gottesmanbacteria bacterium]|nr:hypothetical protein [Candidatus Gottesmanbacteria bacterium]
MGNIRLVVVLLILVAAAMVVGNKPSLLALAGAEKGPSIKTLTQSSQPSPSVTPAIRRVRQSTFVIEKISVKKRDDDKKAGDVHSRLVNHSFSIAGLTSGVSPNAIHLIFDNKVEIVGILVSVDHSDRDVTLSEFSATINAENSGYIGNTKNDTLIHTSYSCARNTSCPGKTDEHLWFGKNSGIELKAGDWISFGAYQINAGSSISQTEPEFIVWYRWLE